MTNPAVRPVGMLINRVVDESNVSLSPANSESEFHAVIPSVLLVSMAFQSERDVTASRAPQLVDSRKVPSASLKSHVRSLEKSTTAVADTARMHDEIATLTAISVTG